MRRRVNRDKIVPYKAPTPDNIYVELSKSNENKSLIDININDTEDIINKASDYYVKVKNLNIDLTYLPKFILPISTLTIEITYTGGAIPDGFNENVPITFTLNNLTNLIYYNITEFILTLNKIITNGNGQPYSPTAEIRNGFWFSLNENGHISFEVGSDYATNNVNIKMNTFLINVIGRLPICNYVDGGLINNTLLNYELEDNLLYEIDLKSTSRFQNFLATAQLPPLPAVQWLVITTSLPINNFRNQCHIDNNFSLNKSKILLKIPTINFNGTFQSYTNNDFVDLITDDSLRNFDIEIFWGDNYCNLFPISTSQYGYVTLILQFIKKQLISNQYRSDDFV